jgi:hypothetical protein
MGADEQVRNLKTRCYYTDYVNHMIRFYLSTPETLQMQGKRKADIENWIAVQDVWHKLNPADKQVLEDIYKAHHRLHEGVRIYCSEKGADPYKTWVLITKVLSVIAKRRGLI